MLKPSIPLPNRIAARRGIATLEFVMALPLLFVLMICIMWEGFWLIGQAEVIVQARNNTWKERFKNLSDNPLSFPILPEHSLPVLPKYNATADYAKKTASTKVQISPAFDLIPGPQSAHTILAGSWDYEAMPLKTPPDLILMGKAALIGAFGNILDVASSASDPLGLLKKFDTAKTESSQIGQQTEQAKDKVASDAESAGSDSGGGGSGGAGGSGDGKSAEQAQKDAEKDLEARKLAIKTRFQAMKARVDQYGAARVYPAGGEFEAAQDAQIAAQRESEEKSKAALTEKNEENKKKLQEEAARAHRKLELARISYKRLEAEALDIVREADALDIQRWELNGRFQF